MNSMDLNEIKGIINFVSCAEDFNKQYDLVVGINLYFYEKLDLSLKYGMVLMNEEKEKALNVPLSLKSYLTLKTPIDTQIMDVQTIYSLVNIISNRSSLNIVMGIIKDVHEDYFESYIVLEVDGEFLCINIPISDIFAIKNISIFPVFVNNEIIEKRKINYEEFIEHIDIGMWRFYS